MKVSWRQLVLIAVVSAIVAPGVSWLASDRVPTGHQSKPTPSLYGLAQATAKTLIGYAERDEQRELSKIRQQQYSRGE